MELLISFSPVILLLILLVGFKMKGHIAGIIGWVLTMIIAVAFFGTGIDIGLIASAKGALASMAVTGMIVTSLMQITFMEESGALERVVVAVKQFSSGNKACQIMVINVIIGTGLVTVGATPAAILPPIMLAMGYSTIVSIALPCLGFDSLCTYAMLAAPVVVLSDILTGAGYILPDGSAPTIEAVSMYFAHYLPIITPCICFAMLIMVGGPKLLKEGIVPALITGLGMGVSAMLVSYAGVGIVLTGIIAAAVTLALMLVYMKIKGIEFFDRSVLTEEDLEIEKKMSIGKALSPWALLILFCCLTNFVPPLYDLLYKEWAMPIVLFPGDSGQPMRLFWQAYFWVIVATLIASVIIKPEKGTWGRTMKRWVKRFPAPMISSIVYFCIAYVMMYTSYAAIGEGGTWVLVDETKNIIYMWAMAAADLFGNFYPVANSVLGLISGFVTGSETSTVALFAKYNLISSQVLGLDPLAVIAGGAVAAGLASVLTPVKLQISSASIDKIGEESVVLAKVLPYSAVLVTISAILTQFFVMTA